MKKGLLYQKHHETKFKLVSGYGVNHDSAFSGHLMGKEDRS